MSVRTFVSVIAGLAFSAVVAACAIDAAPTPTGPRAGPVFAAAACITPDVTKPVISSVTSSPNTLWPPNHKYVPVTVTTVATDECGTPTCAISSATSNEPDNGLGDGDTENDIVKTGAGTLLVRAERSGLGSGRVYTIGVTCTDAAGNASTSFTTVTVPHDQGNGALDKCTKDDRGAGDNKNGGNTDLENKCKHQVG
jgi:hypothetical protein